MAPNQALGDRPGNTANPNTYLKGTIMSASFTLTAADAHNALKASLVCAGRDDTLPMLTCIELTHEGSDIILASTDRFRLGLVRVTAKSGDEYPSFDFGQTVLDGADVKRAAAIVKPAKASQGNWEVTFTLDESGLRYKTLDGLEGVIRVSDSEFPKVRQLINAPTPDETIEDPTFTVNLDYLASFAKVRFTKRDDISVYPNVAGRPIRIAVGDHFIGLLMPIRSVERFAKWDAWTSTPAKVPAAA